MEEYMRRDGYTPGLLSADCRGCHAYSGMILKDCSFYKSNPGATEIPAGSRVEYLDWGFELIAGAGTL